jgi:hypothetical protein
MLYIFTGVDQINCIYTQYQEEIGLIDPPRNGMPPRPGRGLGAASDGVVGESELPQKIGVV